MAEPTSRYVRQSPKKLRISVAGQTCDGCVAENAKVAERRLQEIRATLAASYEKGLSPNRNSNLYFNRGRAQGIQIRGRSSSRAGAHRSAPLPGAHAGIRAERDTWRSISSRQRSPEAVTSAISSKTKVPQAGLKPEHPLETTPAASSDNDTCSTDQNRRSLRPCDPPETAFTMEQHASTSSPSPRTLSISPPATKQARYATPKPLLEALQKTWVPRVAKQKASTSTGSLSSQARSASLPPPRSPRTARKELQNDRRQRWEDYFAHPIIVHSPVPQSSNNSATSCSRARSLDTLGSRSDESVTDAAPRPPGAHAPGTVNQKSGSLWTAPAVAAGPDAGQAPAAPEPCLSQDNTDLQSPQGVVGVPEVLVSQSTAQAQEVLDHVSDFRSREMAVCSKASLSVLAELESSRKRVVDTVRELQQALLREVPANTEGVRIQDHKKLHEICVTSVANLFVGLASQDIYVQVKRNCTT